MKKQARPQRQKSHQERVMGLRSSSAASPHKPKTDYRRKPKHPGKGWDL